MQSERRIFWQLIPRSMFVVVGAVAVAFGLSLIPSQRSMRNSMSDGLVIEALLLFIISWLSHLKSGKLAFITFHPFKNKKAASDWKDRIPKLGSPPLSIEEPEKDMSPEEKSAQEKTARRFRRDLLFAGIALLAIGLIVQYA